MTYQNMNYNRKSIEAENLEKAEFEEQQHKEEDAKSNAINEDLQREVATRASKGERFSQKKGTLQPPSESPRESTVQKRKSRRGTSRAPSERYVFCLYQNDPLQNKSQNIKSKL